MNDLVAEVRQEIARDIQAIKARYSCDKCGTQDFIDHAIYIRGPVTLCYPCRTLINQEARRDAQIETEDPR